MDGVTKMAERWMTIRVYGNILYTTGAWGIQNSGDVSTAVLLTEEHIEMWMKDCADNGVTTVLWQSNCGGTSTHPSSVFPLPGAPLRPHNEAWAPVWDFLGEQVRRFDTLEAGITAAHKHGLRFAYSLCLWDFVDSPFEESLFHPDLWMLSRNGEPFFGVPCYAEPEVQKLMLKHVRDVLNRGVDDLVISFFAHTQAQGVDQPNHYGFNPPLVRAYKERYGVDAVRESFDTTTWYSLYGDFYTDFLCQLHQETSRRSQRLISCTTCDRRWGWGGSGGKQIYDYYAQGGPTPKVDPGCGIEFQWKRWAQEGLADALLVLAPPPKAVSLGRAVRQDAGLPVLLWRKINPGIPAEQWRMYQCESALVGSGELDGYVIHAMLTINYGDYPEKLWAVVQAADNN